MRKKTEPSAIRGRVQAPPSKSYAQRAIAIAAMAEGRSEIHFPGNSDDVHAAISVVKQLGASVDNPGNMLVIDGGIRWPENTLDCGEAGLSIRMFSSVAAIFDKPVTLSGKGSLAVRPMNVISESLVALGVMCTTTDGYLPVTICGPLRGGDAIVDGSFSSQVLTGLLIASPYALEDTRISVNNLKSKPYIDITLDVMRSFGVSVENSGYSEFLVSSGQRYNPAAYVIEGDWSGAAFLLVAGAIGGQVVVENLNITSPQADRAVMVALESAGAVIKASGDSVSVTKAPLRGFEFDATDCPDLFPPLVTLAAYCNGETRIKGAERLIHKESNRAGTLQQEFGKMGIDIRIDGDLMVIYGGRCRGALVSSHGDHRIAMACAVAGRMAEGVVAIEGAEAVAKSWPGFFNDLESI